MKENFTKNNLINTIINIKDVEFIIDAPAAALIEKGESDIALTRLFDKVVIKFSLKEIKESIKEKGIIDRLN